MPGGPPRSAPDFYPRPPRGGRLHGFRRFPSPVLISIHALREEGDMPSFSVTNIVVLFLSTPSARRATSPLPMGRYAVKYFYPRPPRGGRPHEIRKGAVTKYFYPRPPRGGRPDQHRRRPDQHRISIHALREEGDPDDASFCPYCGKFLSTPSARRATIFHS